LAGPSPSLAQRGGDHGNGTTEKKRFGDLSLITMEDEEGSGKSGANNGNGDGNGGRNDREGNNTNGREGNGSMMDTFRLSDPDDSFSQRGPDFDVVYDVSDEENRKRELLSLLQQQSSSFVSPNTGRGGVQRSSSFVDPTLSQQQQQQQHSPSQVSSLTKIYKAIKSQANGLSSSSASRVSPSSASSSSSLATSAVVAPIKRVIAISKMRVAEKQSQERIALSLGAEIIQADAELERMTHLIASAPTRSCKYLSALASGCWILKPEYLIECHRRNEWIDESPFEWRVGSSGTEKFAEKDNTLLIATVHWREEIRPGRSLSGAFSSFNVLLFTTEYLDEFCVMLRCGKANIIHNRVPKTPRDLPSLSNVCPLS